MGFGSSKYVFVKFYVNQGEKMRRKLVTSLCAATFGLLSTIFVASPASAALGPCYGRSGFYFQLNSNGGNLRQIFAYRASGCPAGRAIAKAEADTQSGFRLYLSTYDYACDNFGPTLVTQQVSVGNGGCANPSMSRQVDLRDISPYNFYLSIGGVNSNRESLPPA